MSPTNQVSKKDGPLSFVLFESPFISVSTVWATPIWSLYSYLLSTRYLYLVSLFLCLVSHITVLYLYDFALICPVYVNKVCQRQWKCLYPFLECCPQRDYSREGWPLLTVETEVNGNSKSTNERGPSLVFLLDSSCRYKRFWFRIGCSSQPSTKYMCPHCTLGWNDFNNLLIPNQKWKILFILIHVWKKDFRFFGPFCARSASKFAKSANMTAKLIFSTNFDMGVQKRRFWCWFRIHWKSCKKAISMKV